MQPSKNITETNNREVEMVVKSHFGGIYLKAVFYWFWKIKIDRLRFPVEEMPLFCEL